MNLEDRTIAMILYETLNMEIGLKSLTVNTIHSIYTALSIDAFSMFLCISWCIWNDKNKIICESNSELGNKLLLGDKDTFKIINLPK